MVPGTNPNEKIDKKKVNTKEKWYQSVFCLIKSHLIIYFLSLSSFLKKEYPIWFKSRFFTIFNNQSNQVITMPVSILPILPLFYFLLNLIFSFLQFFSFFINFHKKSKQFIFNESGCKLILENRKLFTNGGMLAGDNLSVQAFNHFQLHFLIFFKHCDFSINRFIDFSFICTVDEILVAFDYTFKLSFCLTHLAIPLIHLLINILEFFVEITDCFLALFNL